MLKLVLSSVFALVLVGYGFYQYQEQERRYLDLQSRFDAKAALEVTYQQQIENAKRETDNLSTAVASGNKRLYIKAACPASSNDVRPSAGAASGFDGGAPELDTSARSDYYRLRTGLEQSREMILGLQTYIKEVCRPQKSPAN